MTNIIWWRPATISQSILNNLDSHYWLGRSISNIEVPLISKAPCFSSKTSRINDGGWLNYSWHNLTEAIYGSNRLIGYVNYKKSISFEKLGLETPGKTCWIDQPSDFLSDYFQRRIEYYSGRSMLFHDGENYLQIPQTVRGTKKYQAMIWRKFDLIRDYMAEKNLPAVHVGSLLSLVMGLLLMTRF